jgi:hypothetical protein
VELWPFKKPEDLIKAWGLLGSKIGKNRKKSKIQNASNRFEIGINVLSSSSWSQ